MPEATRAAALVAALVLASCAGSELVDRTWTLVEFEGRPVAAPGRSTLAIAPDGRVAGDAGCNRYSGRAEATDDRIAFGPLLATKRACEPAVTEQEVRLFEALRRVSGWRIEDGVLSLHGPDRRELLRFRPAG